MNLTYCQGHTSHQIYRYVILRLPRRRTRETTWNAFSKQKHINYSTLTAWLPACHSTQVPHVFTQNAGNYVMYL